MVGCNWETVMYKCPSTGAGWQWVFPRWMTWRDGGKRTHVAGGRMEEWFGHASFRKVGWGGQTPNSVSSGFVTLTKLFQLPSLLFVIIYLGHLPRFHTLTHKKKSLGTSEKLQTIVSVDKGTKQLPPSSVMSGNVKHHSHFEDYFTSSFQSSKFINQQFPFSVPTQKKCSIGAT